MPQNRPCDVTPDSDQDKYSVALQDMAGRWYGLDVELPNVIAHTLDKSEPLQRIAFTSYHQGRGFDKFLPNQYGYFEGRNLWTTTPGKAHATQLARWSKGLRNADFNMPDTNGVTFKPLTGNTLYLDVTFTASATYTAGVLILIVRKQVPAGTVGVPGTLTVELCADSAGYPGTVLSTSTVTSSGLSTTSEYYTWTVSASLTSGTAYHIKVYGAGSDKNNACWEIGCDSSTAGLSSSTNSSWSSNAVVTTYSPYYRVTDADTYRMLKMFIWDDALYAVSINMDGTTASKLYINGVRGKATSGSTTTIVDTGHGTYGATAWTTNRFVGAYVRCIRGTGQGQVAVITSNDGTTLNFAAQQVAFDSTSEYVVYGSDWFVEITGTGLGVVTGDPVIANGIVYFPQGDSTDIRIMHLDYTDADDHAFDVENTNHNKAYFLTTGFDNAEGPVVWRANRTATSGSTPNAAAISVSRAPTAPLSGSPAIPTPVAFGTDLTFKTCIPVGDNTNLINNIVSYGGALQVLKDDVLYTVQNDRAEQILIGTERSPRRTNGVAWTVGSDKQLYIGFNGDVFLISGGGAYSTRLRNNMTPDLSGYVASMTTGENHIFAALNAGTGTSRLMKYSLDTQTWSEQWRGFFGGRKLYGVCWQDLQLTRPRLWFDYAGELLFQEFPLNGARPYDDSGQKYQHEAVLFLPTVDLQSVDPKYYATLTVTSQGLSTEDDPETGHEIVVEYQADNDVGSSTWLHAGYIRSSPSGTVTLGVGNARMLRLRLRLNQNEVSDPIFMESAGLTLYSRSKLSHQWQMFFKLDSSDEEQNSTELLLWLREAYKNPEPLRMFSRFRLYHDRLVTLTDEPYYRLSELDPENNELEADIQILLREVV